MVLVNAGDPPDPDPADAGRSSGGSRSTRVHAFGDDALGTDDAMALAARVRSGEVRPEELAAAAVALAEAVDGALRAVAVPMYDRPRTDAEPPWVRWRLQTFE